MLSVWRGGGETGDLKMIFNGAQYNVVIALFLTQSALCRTRNLHLFLVWL